MRKNYFFSLDSSKNESDKLNFLKAYQEDFSFAEIIKINNIDYIISNSMKEKKIYLSFYSSFKVYVQSAKYKGDPIVT